jgi:Uma2 family endonuclease
MPIALTTPPEPAEPLTPRRKRWTRAECAMLESSGIWDQQRLELIDGELISKMGQNPPHVVFVSLMLQWLVETLGWGRVYQDAPIDVAPGDNPINEPEPDLIVSRQSSRLRTANFQPDEIALLVEVSDSSLRFDLTVKAALYARASIVEYWVLDISGRRLVVHRDPGPTGCRSVVAYSGFERVAPLASPQNELPVGELFTSLQR